MNFSNALDLLRQGYKLERRNWTKEFVYYVPPYSYRAITPAGKSVADGGYVEYEGYFVKYSDKAEMWLPNTGELLADDWTVKG